MSSVCVPCSSTRPTPTTAILSALRTVESRWAITMVVVWCCLRSLSSAACTIRSDSLSSADVASSSSSTDGRLSRARAIATRCFCPPESCPPPWPTRVSYPSGKPAMKSCAFAIRAASTISSRVASGRPYEMLFATESSKSTGSCPTRPIWRRSHCRLSSRMSTPSRVTEPPFTS
mmetsp:Transcript_23442/g.60301  ORF Transcript_23442/g.60301 Transcript_23442/m.60301 type:complete len:175 (-) Transcript_23442:614-1138(-)